MASSSSNPFYFGGAVPPEQFVGRQAEVNELLNHVSRMECVTLFGERRIGKSSLLTYLEYIYRKQVPDPTIRLIMVDLQEAGLTTNQATFLNYVMQALLKHVVWDQLPELQELERALKMGKKLTLVEFTDVLKKISEHRLVRPVVCIDEFEKFFEHPEEFDTSFFNGLRYLSGNLRAIGWITASRVPVRELFNREALTSDLPTIFMQLKLGNFTPLEADMLLKKGPFTPDERQKLLVLATRHPGRLQLAAKLYFDERKKPLMDWEQFRQKYEEKSAAAFIQKKFRPLLGRLPLQLIHTPYWLGRMAQAVGNGYEKLAAWIIGGVIVIVIILVILGQLDAQTVLNHLGQ